MQHKTPWRSKEAVNPAPGDGTSTDQMVSSVKGFVQQAVGSLTRRRIVGATVFIDHATDFTYTHLMEDLTLNATLAAKESYKRLAATFGVTVKNYHADNSRYADTGWKEARNALQQNYT